MSNQNLSNQSRRNFLKGAAYTSALSIGGISSLAFALNGDVARMAGNVIGLANGNISPISVMQQQMLRKETVSLFNNTDHPMMLDAMHPIVIERNNGSLVVKPNLIQSEAFSGMIMMLPRQRISFDIQTTDGIFNSAEIADVRGLEGERLHITSEHSAFNKLIPVTNPNISVAKPFMAVA